MKIMAMPAARNIALSILSTLLFLVVIELGVRAYFYATTFNPYYLFFGMVMDESRHDNEQDGYFKFFPNKNLHQGTSSHSIPTKINSHGFRGADFSVEKGAGRRIVTMGGSSTFGYYSRDDFTYPSLMQSHLNQADATGERYEVINVGIPHMQTKHIARLLDAEVLSFEPDLITLYSGCNDTWNLYRLHADLTARETGRIMSILGTARSVLLGRSLAFKKANDLYLNSDLSSFRFKHGKGDDGLNKTVTYLYATRKIGERDFRNLSNRVRDRYASNLRQIADMSRENDIELVLIRQKYTLNKLRSRNEADALPYASANGYYEEVAMAEERLRRQGWLWLEEASILTHSMLMDALMQVAAERDLTVVDGIAALDRDPGYLKSYVHLSENGNAVLAKAIAARAAELLANRDAGT